METHMRKEPQILSHAAPGATLSAYAMKPLKMNFDEIQKAMEDVARDSFEYFLDLETGEVLSFSEEILSEVKSRLYDGDYEDIEEDIEYIEFDEEPEIPEWMEDEVELALEILLDEEERYIRIPERKSLSAHADMTSFTETVEDPMLRNQLTEALHGKGAFRKFKDILIRHPKERKRWHRFNAKAMQREILQWLHSVGVVPES